MGQIVKHSQHIYTAKSSAMRAARKAVGHSYPVEAPELENRFEGCITITADMLGVEACEGGWRWTYAFDLAEVMVAVRSADGTGTQRRYADVAHWKDASTTQLDAAGRVPLTQTRKESQWSQTVKSGRLKALMATLNERRSLPLDTKIEMSLARIRNWYKAWDGNVSVSYSGGKDSSLLLWLVRQEYPHVPAVFSHTGLEYPEVVRQVLNTPGHVIVRPKLRFAEVIARYGWPMASKKIARGIEILRNLTDKNQNIYRLYDQGVNRFGQPVKGRRVSQCWRFLVNAPFKVSDKCCNIMKKEPMRRYCRATGRVPFVGLLASDSKERELSYLKNGCNAYYSQNPKSTPLAFWREQDVLECIQRYHIPIASVYGDILCDNKGSFYTTGLRRTGCIFCAFGIHMDLNDGLQTRFELLKKTHPRLWKYVMHRLGLAEVLRYCRDTTPWPALANRIRWGE